MSTNNDDCMLEAQVCDLERLLEDAEKSLSALYAASKAVLVAWMTQEPCFTIEASQTLTERLIELREAFEKVSCEEIGVLETMGEVGHWVQRPDGTCFELKFDHEVGGMKFCQPLSREDFIDSHGPEMAADIRKMIAEKNLYAEAAAWGEIVNQEKETVQ